MFDNLNYGLRIYVLLQPVQKLREPFLTQRDPKHLARAHRTRTDRDDQPVIPKLAEQRAQRRVVGRDEVIPREVEQHVVRDRRHLGGLCGRRRIHVARISQRI